MSNLSQYVSLSIALDNSGPTPAIRLIDNSPYPSGIAAQISGYFTLIQQPDNISFSAGSADNPAIYYSGTGLLTYTGYLRLNSIARFQQGGYLIVYVVSCPGYDDTILQTTFNVTYSVPTVIIGNNFNNFRPRLTVSDNTVYAQSNLNLVSVTDNWVATINSVNGSQIPLSGIGLTFDLNYGGLYYDANYLITLRSIATWTLSTSNSSVVTLIDDFTLTQSFDADTPASLQGLLGYLTGLKARLDAAICDYNLYPRLMSDYLLAQAVYAHMRFRGCYSDFTELSDYVAQLQKIFNNDVNPQIVHTNLPIPSYDFGCGGGAGGSVDWNAITNKPSTTIIEWTVGQAGFPGEGQNVISDNRLAGYKVIIFRNNELEPNYTKVVSSPVVTFTNAFTGLETIRIQSIVV